ncbi:DoxX family protein [Rhizosphaericola mali]|uniref:DoxX family protein n=1 Tax=Rhizosphaericola mali TaxID=2545455 RepID=A0A5P2G3C4_9BACT|nr:DoxX family protein [Rhizosphaericola mali]QES88629.1 DoxX family protein [Rhizosphaericola mali]
MLDILSWILQIIIALFFIKPALDNMRLSATILIERHQLKPGNSVVINRLLGIFQLLGVFGLILPKLLQIYPILTPISAIGFFIMMTGAVFVHKNDQNKKLLMIVLSIAIISFLVFVLNKQYF